MLRTTLLTVICFIALFSFATAQSSTFVNVTQLITNMGYPCVDHSVVTEDGYILSLQNIPGKGPPVYLQHGFLDSAATWVMGTKQESLAFILADAGYNVWLGNTRGNTYCLDNVNFSNTSQLFWNFSFDQIAQYDLPTKIEYILSNSAPYTQLSYVGHSEGTLIGFIEFAKNQQLASKVNVFIALAPIVYLTHAGDVIKVFSQIPPAVVERIFGTMSFGELWSDIDLVSDDTCTNDPEVCLATLCALAGCEIGNINKTDLPVIFSHFPAGSSVQNLLHYRQYVLTPSFQMYDYGSPNMNMQYYNQTTPPLYSLSTLDMKIALFHGSHDKLSDPTDVSTLISQLPIPPFYSEQIRGYGHADFVWGEDAHRKLYPTIITLIQNVTATF